MNSAILHIEAFLGGQVFVFIIKMYFLSISLLVLVYCLSQCPAALYGHACLVMAQFSCRVFSLFTQQCQLFPWQLERTTSLNPNPVFSDIQTGKPDSPIHHRPPALSHSHHSPLFSIFQTLCLLAGRAATRETWIHHQCWYIPLSFSLSLPSLIFCPQ